MTDPIYAMDLRQDLDVFTARQAGREVAAAVGLEGQDLVRIATALSEVSREVVLAGGGRVAFRVPNRGLLSIELVTGSATAQLHQGDPGTGVDAASRLMDAVTVDTDDAGHARIRLEKKVAAPNVLGGNARAALRRKVEASAGRSPLDELRTQNRELMLALEEAQARRYELTTLNRELEETNRGVMALYDELSGELETTNKGVVALYAEIDEKNRQLREASEAKTRFLRNISHELRTPGNSVLGLARLLLYSDEHLTGEQRQQVELIESSALDLVTAGQRAAGPGTSGVRAHRGRPRGRRPAGALHGARGHDEAPGHPPGGESRGGRRTPPRDSAHGPHVAAARAAQPAQQRREVHRAG